MSGGSSSTDQIQRTTTKEKAKLPSDNILPSKPVWSKEKGYTRNSVQGGESVKDVPSFSRDVDLWQVTPDRKCATAAQQPKLNTETLRIGTRNVRTLYQKGKLDDVIQEMEILKINILGIAEVRMTQNGKFFQNDMHTVIYSGGDTHERVGLILDSMTAENMKGHWAVSDWVLLVKSRGGSTHTNNKSIGRGNHLVLLATGSSKTKMPEQVSDNCNEVFNANVGNGREGSTVGTHGPGERNDRGGLVPRQQPGDFEYMVSESQETPLDMAQPFTYNKKPGWLFHNFSELQIRYAQGLPWCRLW